MNGLEITLMFVIGYLCPTVAAYFIYEGKKEILKRHKEDKDKEHIRIWGWMDYFPHDVYLFFWAIITLFWVCLVAIILLN